MQITANTALPMGNAACILRCKEVKKFMENMKKWSKDWANFDWSRVKDKIKEMEGKEGDEKAGYDVGISRDEFLEYLDWLNLNDNEGYYKVALSIQLAEMGLNESEIEWLVAHPDELVKIMRRVLTDNPKQ